MAKKRSGIKRTSKKDNDISEIPQSNVPVHIEAALQDLEKHVFLAKNKPAEDANKIPGGRNIQHPSNGKPLWFYICSIFSAFLFTVYISIYATIYFESIEYMNITIVFLFIAMISYFLISGIFFISEKKLGHSLASFLFFIGIVLVMVYAFKAVDTSNLVKFSIFYSIIVAAISCYVITVRK